MLASEEAVYEDPGQKAPMRFMASGGGFCEARNSSRWLDQKHSSFSRPTCSENTKWYTADVCMSVSEQSIRNPTVRLKAPMEFWGAITPQITCRQVSHLQELPQQEGPGHCRM